MCHRCDIINSKVDLSVLAIAKSEILANGYKPIVSKLTLHSYVNAQNNRICQVL